MADIELVIKIPEDYYKVIMKIPDNQSTADMLIIKNGIPLPKGHGRLIDADELKKHKYHDNDKCENAVSIAQVEWQPTIIEADKAESEDKE